LYVSPYGFWIFPKQAFSVDQLQKFKALLLTHVKEGTLLPSPISAFPVTLTPASAEQTAIDTHVPTGN
jgi:hypothetical protein